MKAKKESKKKFHVNEDESAWGGFLVDAGCRGGRHCARQPLCLLLLGISGNRTRPIEWRAKGEKGEIQCLLRQLQAIRVGTSIYRCKPSRVHIRKRYTLSTFEVR